MINFKSKEKYYPRIDLIRFSKKYILIISVTFCALLNSLSVHGQEPIPFLTGKWVGTVLYEATSTGFYSSKDSISINFSEQSILEFKGNAESKTNGKKTSWNFEGYLDESGRDICLINQNNKKMLVGFVIMTNEIPNILIKLYSWDDENNKATVYILKKIKTSNNKK